ncbi:MAG TPA: response regulator [Vitreimonas sp.]|nr:response regulator [Vitreimonas sp.]
MTPPLEKPPQILLIETNLLNAELIQVTLQRKFEQLELIIVSTFNEAQPYLNPQLDIILCEWQSSLEMIGILILNELQQQQLDIPVIVLTAYHVPEIQAELKTINNDRSQPLILAGLFTKAELSEATQLIKNLLTPPANSQT